MSDLLKRLQGAIVFEDADDCSGDLLKADVLTLITALQAQNRDLREALEAIERGDDSLDGMQGDIARGALEANKQETDQ